MKKIEMYVTDAEYDNLTNSILKFQETVMEHQEDNVYTDEERAQIINACGMVQFYLSKGLKKQMSEMEEYVNRYSERKITENEKPSVETPIQTKEEVKEEAIKDEKKPEQKPTFNVNPNKKDEKIKYETKTEAGSDFDLM